MTHLPRLIACLLLLTSASMAAAQAPVFDDPSKAKSDKDFAVQGEYLGKLKVQDEEITFAVQVIARGKGKFQAAAFVGGLPGAGWNGETNEMTDGQRDGDAVEFENNDVIGVIRNGVLVVEAKAAMARGELKKQNRKSPTLGKKPPAGAIVLFDGKDIKQWKKGKVTEDKLLMAGVESKQTFGDHSIHIEFRLPYQPEARGQGRGNSGIYVQGRYEVQMLDSFGLAGKNNECGGIYETRDPNVNMCFPPLTWQTYDIDFTAAVYEDGKEVKKPRITVRHNGVVVHRDVELPKTTRASRVKAGPENGPIYLQHHGNPVRYRNIWVVEK